MRRLAYRRLAHRRRVDRREARRRAHSLVELVAVLALVALAAAAAFGVLGLSTLSNVRADGFARLWARDLAYARRCAIATGDNHFLLCSNSSGNVTAYQLWRRASAGNVVVDQLRPVPEGVTATASHAALEFDFDGAALSAYIVDVAGPERSWRLSTAVATGTTQLTQTAP